MSYKNGKEVLPPRLLRELQKYIQGELVYIPKSTTERASWGEVSGSRRFFAKRNEEIIQLHEQGCSHEELEERFHLSNESIRKILYRKRKAMQS